MNNVIEIGLLPFLSVYLLLIVVSAIMKFNKISQSRELLIASIKMTLQLTIAGYVLTYIIDHPHPLFTCLYILSMILFSVRRVFNKCKGINKAFKRSIVIAISLSGLSVLTFFIVGIIRVDLFNPRYTIPISGMIFGNAMTGVILGINHFHQSLSQQKAKVNALINIGVHPKTILKPMVSHSLETALLPSINGMVGMGIVSLPGMMTGQILAGTVPTTAIMYQVAIIIAITASVVLTTFLALQLGYKSMYDHTYQVITFS